MLPRDQKKKAIPIDRTNSAKPVSQSISFVRHSIFRLKNVQSFRTPQQSIDQVTPQQESSYPGVANIDVPPVAHDPVPFQSRTANFQLSHRQRER